MSKKVLLVGHCGPDSSYLRSAVRKALPEATVLSADDSTVLERTLKDGVDLVLLNRTLDYGFDVSSGVDLIKTLAASHPDVRTMLVSNYPDAQAAASAAGALPGFGKREIGTAKVTTALRQALA